MHKAFGKNWDKFVIIAQMLAFFAFVLAYFNIMLEIVQVLIIQFGVQGGDREFKRGFIALILSLILFPIAFAQDTKILKEIFFYTQFNFIYIAVVLGIELMIYMDFYYVESTINWYVTDFDNVINGFCIIMLQFSSFPELFPLYSELYNPTYRRVDKWLHDSGLVNYKFCLIVGLLGYLSTFTETIEIALNRTPPNGYKNIPMMIASVILVIHMLIGVSLNLVNLKKRFNYVFFNLDGFFLYTDILFILFFIGGPAAISLIYKSVSDTLALAGSLSAALCGFLFILILQLDKSEKWSTGKNIAYLIFFGILIGIACLNLGI